MLGPHIRSLKHLLRGNLGKGPGDIQDKYESGISTSQAKTEISFAQELPKRSIERIELQRAICS
jgi:hypothetical protein